MTARESRRGRVCLTLEVLEALSSQRGSLPFRALGPGTSKRPCSWAGRYYFVDSIPDDVNVTTARLTTDLLVGPRTYEIRKCGNVNVETKAYDPLSE